MSRINDLTEDYASADYNDENPVPAETPAPDKSITPVETTTTAETPAPAETPTTAETPAVEAADETTAGLEWHDLDKEWDAFAGEWEIDSSKKKDGEKKKESLPDQQRKNATNLKTKKMV